MSESSTTVAGAQDTDGGAAPRGLTVLAVVSVLVPIGAWALSLVGSWSLQELTCLGYASIGASAPEPALFGVLVALNVVALVLTLAAGAAGLWVLRRAADGPRARLLRFLGTVGAVSALVFAYSIVLIGMHPLVLEVC